MKNKKSTPLASLRDFPAVEILAGNGELAPFVTALTRPIVVAAIRSVLEHLKKEYQSGEGALTIEDVVAAVSRELRRLQHQMLTSVINGTGIIIHTNLGRAPLSEEMLRKAAAVACGYSNLEYDLAGGSRGKRGVLIEHLLANVCETEDATIVNNNAAALFIILNTLGLRREVIISRGELVQIGGGFKIPEIMAKSGVRLVEVGTTNRTSLDDYRQAITSRTAMILKVHRSNFAQIGFVEETGVKELGGLCREQNLILVNDIGSGLLAMPPGVAFPDEPTVGESVRAGADLTCFSGDKLLGGAQAGLIVGRGELVGRIKKNPLYRAIRCDKIVFAITTEVLLSYLRGTYVDDIPIWKMISVPVTALKVRGEAILAACSGRDMVLVATEAYLGGGTTPTQTLPSLAVSVRSSLKANVLAQRFRAHTPPLIGRVQDDDFLLDLRTIPAEMDTILITAINSIVP